MEKPGIVSVFSVVIASRIIIKIITIFFHVVAIGLTDGGVEPILSMFPLLITIALGVEIPFLYYFFTLKEKAKTWANISFGTSLISIIIMYIIMYIKTPITLKTLNIPSLWVPLIFTIIIWIAINNYIKKNMLLFTMIKS